MLGTLSDRCDSPCGRRRPFMFAGPLTFCGALLVMQVMLLLTHSCWWCTLLVHTGGAHCAVAPVMLMTHSVRLVVIHPVLLR